MIRHFDAAVMPRRCAFCGTRCRDHEPDVCRGCYDDLPWRDRLVDRDSPPFTAVVVPLHYSFPVDAALKALKFRRRLHYVPVFAELLARLATALPDDVDAVLPVPLHWRREAWRGFNQALELSARLRKRTGLPLLANVRRDKATAKQSGLDAAQRRDNLRQAFAVRGLVDAHHVLIVDDVMTTGETVRQLAQAVLAAGASRVSALAVARN